jgi:membrane fusion protein (multidrug efflux system)
MLKKILIAIILLAGIAAAGWYIYSSQQQPDAGSGGFPPTVIASTEVTVANWEPRLYSVGSLVATNGISVSTEVSGIVSEIIFESGQAVEEGQLLIKLDDSVDLAALEALRAERRLAEVRFNRVKDLIKKRVTSKSEFDESEANFDAAKARVKQQEAIVKRKSIHAPFTGLTGIRQVDKGQYIDAGDPIVSLQALDPIYVDYTLPERYLSRLQVGQVINIKLDAIPGQSFTGKISAINPGIETGTRTIKVRATLDNPEGQLRPGMFAEVITITDQPQPTLTLPRTAISFNTYGNFVFVINKNEQGMLNVKRTAIKTGEKRQGWVAVTGLEAGTQVVRAGINKLRDGAPIKIDNQVKLDDRELQSE